jgi:hypothetical protein
MSSKVRDKEDNLQRRVAKLESCAAKLEKRIAKLESFVAKYSREKDD